MVSRSVCSTHYHWPNAKITAEFEIISCVIVSVLRSRWLQSYYKHVWVTLKKYLARKLNGWKDWVFNTKSQCNIASLISSCFRLNRALFLRWFVMWCLTLSYLARKSLQLLTSTFTLCQMYQKINANLSFSKMIVKLLGSLWNRVELHKAYLYLSNSIKRRIIQISN